MNNEMKDVERWNDPAAAFLTVRLLSHQLSHSSRRVVNQLADVESQTEKEIILIWTEITALQRSATTAKSIRYSSRVSVGRSRSSEWIREDFAAARESE